MNKFDLTEKFYLFNLVNGIHDYIYQFISKSFDDTNILKINELNDMYKKLKRFIVKNNITIRCIENKLNDTKYIPPVGYMKFQVLEYLSINSLYKLYIENILTIIKFFDRYNENRLNMIDQFDLYGMINHIYHFRLRDILDSKDIKYKINFKRNLLHSPINKDKFKEIYIILSKRKLPIHKYIKSNYNNESNYYHGIITFLIDYYTHRLLYNPNAKRIRQYNQYNIY